MNVVVAPEAELDLTDGALFYAEEADAELGLTFIAKFERALGVLAAYPNIGAPWRSRTHRFPLRRFAYSVVYRIHRNEVRVIALAHQRRSPGYWAGRK